MTNVIRENMVRASVARATYQNEAITIENCRKYLPGPHAIAHLKGPTGKLLCQEPDFELDEIDLAPWQPEPMEIEGERTADESAPDGDTAPPETRAELPREVRYAQASEKLVALEQERAELRIELDLARKAELAARHERDRVAQAFVAGFGPPISPAELIRQHIKSEMQTRQDIKDGKLPGRRVNPVGGSMVDRYASAQRGGNPAFAGRGYARGAFPASRRGGMVERPKLPSQR